MIQTNFKRLFIESGIEEIRPSDSALKKMDISRRRFTMLWENTHSTELTVQELESIKLWLEKIKNIPTDKLVG